MRFVNSAAHLWGERPYDPKSNPAENPWVAILSVGEGWHNWHHKYPFDYAASEFGVASQFNPTKLFIDGNWEHSIADGPRAPVVFARGCSTSGAADNQPTGAPDDQPNGRIELWPILKEGEQCFRKELWLVAAEPISPGQEIRVDYAQLGAEYHIPPATPAGGGAYTTLRPSASKPP